MKSMLFAAAAAGALAVACPALAAQSEAPAADQALEQVIVTARAGVAVQRKVEASYAITTVPAETLRLQAPRSVAEVLKNVPGFWVEASGGVGGANIRARGIPIEGYAAIGLQEDGLPVQHDGGLGFLNSDFSFRQDETVDRVEVVRGGPSTIFASYAPAGVVNFITRKPTDEWHAVARAELGEFGYYRGDAWVGGPLANGFRFGLGGFWRQNDGVRDPGFTSDKGGQFRVQAGYDFKGGSIDFNVKHIDDNTIFYLPAPLTFDVDGDTAGLAAFDPLYGVLAGPDTARMVFRTDHGLYDFDLTRGADLKLTQWTLDGRFELPADWRLEEKIRYKEADLARAGLFPNTPVAGAARIAQDVTAARMAQLGIAKGQLVYANGGGAFAPENQNGNGLVMDAFAREQDITLDELINDTRLLRQFEWGGMTHDVALGFYYANAKESFLQEGSAVLLEVRNHASRLDLVGLNAAGQVVARFTENGISRYGSQFNNADGESHTYALYASDEWRINDRLRLDFGVRWETIDFTGRNERSATINLNQSPTFADDQAIRGTGVFDALDRKFDGWGGTIGANYQWRPELGVFARYTRAFRLPSLGDVITSPTRTDVRVQAIDLAEGGVKWESRLLSLYATAFYTHFDSQSFTETRYDQPTNSYISRTEFASTYAYGVELEGVVRPTRWFDVGFNATFQEPRLGDFIFNERVAKVAGACPAATDQSTAGSDCLRPRDFSDNLQIRSPRVSARVTPGVNLLDGRLRAQVQWEYYGDRYSDIANTLVIPEYFLLNASVRVDVTPRLSLYGYANNLTNEIGLTEGNPRAGQFISGEAGARYYLARPELGRSVRVAAMYRF